METIQSAVDIDCYKLRKQDGLKLIIIVYGEKSGK